MILKFSQGSGFSVIQKLKTYFLIQTVPKHKPTSVYSAHQKRK